MSEADGTRDCLQMAAREARGMTCQTWSQSGGLGKRRSPPAMLVETCVAVGTMDGEVEVEKDIDIGR